MNKKIFYIIIGAILLFALLLGLWFWLFSGSSPVSQTGDLFGSGSDVNGGSSTGNSDGNGQAPIGSTVGASGNVITQTGGGGSGASYTTSTNYPDATWLDGSNSTGGGTGSLFNPTPINAVDNSSISGTPYIVNSPSGNSGTDLGLAAGLLGAAGGCVLNYLSAQGVALAVALVPNPVSFLSVQTNSTQNNTNQGAKAIMDCLVRSLARIAIRQITAETVNWINSGFEGKPAFVENFGKFFEGVADQAAGEFIQGSNLSFLCSPFQLKVKVAIAQSYARRQSGAAQSCTLSGVVGNVDNFLKGNFSEGGWPGLLSFTTTPTNNPFGAYMSAQVELNNKIIASTEEANRRISPEGFLSQQKCDVDLNGNNIQDTCKTVTPGSIVAEPLKKVINSDVDSLELANSVDEILNALLNSLIKKVFQGLSSLGSGNGSAALSTQDVEATDAASELLQKLQSFVQYAQQYGSIQQGSIQDVQTTQANLNELDNCWASVNEDSKQAQAAEKVDQLETLVTNYNNQILIANSAVANAQELQSNVYLARSLADVQAVDAQFQNEQISGQLITETAVSLAQQDRTSLQSQMASINADTSTKLQQCYAQAN